MEKLRRKSELQELMSACDTNYLRVQKLFPDLADCDSRRLMIHARNGHQGYLLMQVEERFKYTTTLKLAWHLSTNPWLKGVELVVRLYHDAQVAEVMQDQNHKVMRGHYEYPNGTMRQADEKLQVNVFLGEWLSYCLSHGHSTDKLAVVNS